MKQALLEAILERREKILKKNQFFEFLIDGLTVEHLSEERISKLDGSEVVETFARKLGYDFAAYLKGYIKLSTEDGRLAEIFPAKILEVLKPSGTEPLNASGEATVA